MTSSVLKVGDNVDIRLQKEVQRAARTGGRAHVYKSQICDIQEDGKLVMNMPIVGNKVVMLPEGYLFEFCFYTDDGLKGCLGKLEKSYKVGKVHIFTMIMETPLEKSQRRAFYRFECLMDFSYFVMTKAEQELGDPEEILEYHYRDMADTPLAKGQILDISGGGLRVAMDEPVEAGEDILVRLKLPMEEGNQRMDLVGRILTMNRIATDKVKKYQNRIEFKSIKEKQQETIVRFIFQEERKKRSKHGR